MLMRLLWKEWRENLWKLGFGLVTSVAFTIMLFRIRLFPDMANCAIISVAQLFVIPVVYALDLFSGEMSNRTIHLLFKVPVARWQVFFSKYLMAIACVGLIFISTGLFMEVLGHGREAEFGMLFRMNALFGLCVGAILTWFSVFGSQSRNEAGSLVALFGVIIGWGIVWFWSSLCEVTWASCFVPYLFTVWAIEPKNLEPSRGLFLATQIAVTGLALTIACYRYVKIRRVL
ncbi:MAG: ABC transporter permease subunit [Planctomycetes bacterium]|nr:ABC transporter permease subunit [Planctomycetota bacterium]